MQEKIIDSHAHLGDIFHENRNITFKTNIKKRKFEDRFRILEESLMEAPLFSDDEEALLTVINGGQYRCWESTLEDLTKQLDENEMTGIVLLPCLPNTSFEEYLAASKLEPRIIPFTAADFSLSEEDMVQKLKQDIKRGAKGLKLHPVLQNVRLTTEPMYKAVKVFEEAGLPVVIHVGEGIYYTPDKDYPWNSKYGAIEDFFEFAHNLPNATLIAAHCGAFAKEFKEGTQGLKHVYTDTSFCSVAAAREAVEVLGEDRVLYGTDSPFVRNQYGIEILRQALQDDAVARQKVFYENIATLIY